MTQLVENYPLLPCLLSGTCRTIRGRAGCCVHPSSWLRLPAHANHAFHPLGTRLVWERCCPDLLLPAGRRKVAVASHCTATHEFKIVSTTSRGNRVRGASQKKLSNVVLYVVLYPLYLVFLSTSVLADRLKSSSVSLPSTYLTEDGRF